MLPAFVGVLDSCRIALQVTGTYRKQADGRVHRLVGCELLLELAQEAQEIEDEVHVVEVQVDRRPDGEFPGVSLEPAFTSS